MTSRFRLAHLLALTACAMSAPAQAPAPETDSSRVTKALRALVEVETWAPPAEFAARTIEVANALADRPEAKTLRSATDLLTDISDWDQFPVEHVDTLLQAIKEHRRKSSPETLLPIVLLALRFAGERLEVQLSVAETFGQESGVGDVARAQTALRRLVTMLPTDLASFQRAAEQVRSFCQFLDDDTPGNDGIATLRSYFDLLAHEPEDSFSMHTVTPSDLKAFSVIEAFVEKQRKGEQQPAVDLLQQLQALQPKNAAFLLPLAEARASVGPAFDYGKAKKCLQDFLDVTDRGAAEAPPRDPWETFGALRNTLDLLQWGNMPGQPGRNATVECLRKYAGDLLPQIKMRVADHLVISPDRAHLEKLLRRMQDQEPGLAKDRDEARAVFERARDQCGRAEGAYKNARSGRGFSQRRADLHDQWMTAKRVLERAQSDFNHADEQLQINQHRNKDYADRLKRFGN